MYVVQTHHDLCKPVDKSTSFIVRVPNLFANLFCSLTGFLVHTQIMHDVPIYER